MMHVAGHVFNLMSSAETERIHRSALDLLDQVSLEVQDARLLHALGDIGARIDMQAQRARFSPAVTLLTMEQPAFVAELLTMIHGWNLQRMRVVLSAPVDLYIRRAWYEGCDFVTPRFFQQVVLPQIKAEADLAHEYGARFGYICSSGTRPMLDFYLEAGIDVLIGIDPVQGTHTDMPLIKNKLGDRVCLWGDVSGAVTVEQGTEEEVRAAVRTAISTLGPRGFVLSPIDNLTVDAPRTWHNLDVLIQEWQQVR
jgi:hypothetical protein